MTTCQPGICLLHAAQQEVQALTRKLDRCRDVMECNDPIAAREIFGSTKAIWRKPAGCLDGGADCNGEG